MIINGFGGGAAGDLGLTVLRPNTTLWSQGVANGCTLNTTLVKVVSCTYWDNRTTIHPDSSIEEMGGYNYGFFYDCFWFGGCIGKTISADFWCTTYATKAPYFDVHFGIFPIMYSLEGRGNLEPASFTSLGVIACSNTRINLSARMWTASFVVPTGAIFGYLGVYFETISPSTCYFDNIRISA